MKFYRFLLTFALVFAAASVSFAQAVENPFENLLQSADISNTTVGNTVGNGDISAVSDKSAQTAPDSREISAETGEFSTFSEKFSTEETEKTMIQPAVKFVSTNTKTAPLTYLRFYGIL